jgi:hypothetical protein
MKVTMEYKGFSYTFDPEKQAMKEAGITELTPENRKNLAGKILEYQKVARHRAHVGAVLLWLKDQIGKGIDVPNGDLISAFHENQRPC